MAELSPISAVKFNEGAQFTNAGDTVNKDDFLTLLVTQLQHQDPLEPLDNAEFVSQMTQFSSLEQLISIRDAVEATAMFLAAATQPPAETPVDNPEVTPESPPTNPQD